MTDDERRTLIKTLHDISTMIILAAEMHRQHTRMLCTLLEAHANVADVISEMRANEEMFCGYLTRITALADTLRVTLHVPAPDPEDDSGHDELEMGRHA